MSIFTRVVALLCAATLPSVAVAAEPEVSPARFAVIYPEADLDDEDSEPTTEAASLPQPAKKLARTNARAAAKNGKSAVKPAKSPATVTPLKRDRPKREVDPPKTRRRPLGW